MKLENYHVYLRFFIKHQLEEEKEGMVNKQLKKKYNKNLLKQRKVLGEKHAKLYPFDEEAFYPRPPYSPWKCLYHSFVGF